MIFLGQVHRSVEPSEVEAPVIGFHPRPGELGVVNEVKSQLSDAFDVTLPLVFRPVLGVVINPELHALFGKKPAFIGADGRHEDRKQKNQEGVASFHGGLCGMLESGFFIAGK